MPPKPLSQTALSETMKHGPVVGPLLLWADRGPLSPPTCPPRDPTPRSWPPMDWRDRAACLDEDPELFFPIGNTGPAILQIEQAKAVCRRCEVVDTCLKWAIETGQDSGVWGGLSEDERRALKRRNARARRAG